MRVKIFSMMSLYGKSGMFKKPQPDGGRILEDQINQWLSQNKGVEIVRVESKRLWWILRRFPLDDLGLVQRTRKRMNRLTSKSLTSGDFCAAELQAPP